MLEQINRKIIHSLPTFANSSIDVSILRLDLVHPVVSGNKWFKLQGYLLDAIKQEKKCLATFGGAYSNHIVATAFAAKEMGLDSIGFIRGDELQKVSHTLTMAKNYGMKIQYINRTNYIDKTQLMNQFTDPSLYWIMEGGYGNKGAEGAADILSDLDISAFTHILCSTGTGTTLAGILKTNTKNIQIIGISALKNHFTLEMEIRKLLTKDENMKNFTILNDYHFGGYAKHPKELIQFMKSVWESEKVPTDIVYTSKLLFATKDLIEKKYFPHKSHLLVIHSGGLQGNYSLPEGILPF